MRYLFALLLAACLTMTGCSGSTPTPAVQRLKQPLATLTATLCERSELSLPVSLDDELCSELLGLQPDDVADYSGYLSMDGESPDHLVAVQAAPGRAEAVARALEARRAFLQEAYAADPLASGRIAAGKVVFRGDYVFLVIAGHPERDPALEADELQQMIVDNFEK